MKQLLTNIFGGEEKPDTDKTETVSQMTEPSASGTKKYSGWKLTLSHSQSQDGSSRHSFCMSVEPTDEPAEFERNRETLKSLVANVHTQLNSIEEDQYINFDNTLVIRKDQFVSLSLVTYS